MSTNMASLPENSLTLTSTLKKRGRKSKKEVQEALNSLTINENITIQINENLTPKSEASFIDELISSDNENNIIQTTFDDKPVAKKRGRKPKGGKIIQQIVPLNNIKETKPNIILHLKCFAKDLNSSQLFETNFDEGYSFNKPILNFEIFNSDIDNFNKSIASSANLNDYDLDTDNNYNVDSINRENDIKEIWKKLKVLEHNLHINNTCNKKSACFWDTCEFDNPPVYIPKYYMNETYKVYGCFCSPECAVAHLMEENIDSSVKFERYQLINHIYSKVYNYNKNIKPAPNPFYMLEKYLGNLSIQEYRSLLRNERLFLVVDKPLTRIMPELHEDNDDFIINNKIIPSNTYQIKKKLQKKQTKTNILSERFGLTNN